MERINEFSFDLDGTKPSSRFFGVSEPQQNLKEYHPFGCLVFVLDLRLQGGQIGPHKWEPRSRVGIYLGHSPMHYGSVALVLNPQTGNVSPQYHTVFDDNFTTVQHMRDGTLPPTWQDMCQQYTELDTNEAFDLVDIWFKRLKGSEGMIKDPFAIISDKSGGKSGPLSVSSDK